MSQVCLTGFAIALDSIGFAVLNDFFGNLLCMNFRTFFLHITFIYIYILVA